MIEVVFLGVGAALPRPGCSNSAYLVHTDALTLLVDCGPAILQQLAASGRDPGQLTHVFVSHRHGDHSLGYPMLLLWWALHQPTETPLPTQIANDATWPSLDALTGHTFRDVASRVDAPRLSFPAHEPYTLKLGQDVTLRTWPMKHSTFAPVSGLRLEFGDTVLAFTSDTEPCEAVLSLARDADLLVHDSTYSVTINPETVNGMYGHSTAQVAGRHAALAGAKRLALVHQHSRYQGQDSIFVQEAAREFGGIVFVPQEGEVMVLRK